MNIKDNRKLLIIGAAVIIIAWLLFTGWRLYKGIKPVITPPPDDIADIIEDQDDADTSIPLSVSSSINETEFPLTIPDGLSISIFAKDLGKPRVIAFDPNGVMLVSLIDQGKVVALPDIDGDGRADEEVTVISGLKNPHGLAFEPGTSFLEQKLYIAETHQVVAYDYDLENLTASNGEKIIDLPDDGGHYTRTIAFTYIHDIKDLPPELKLLTSVGSSCNVCDEADWRRSLILISNPDGSELSTYASGLRNAVFMREHPYTGFMYVTEMGRDWLGDDLPPDEINKVVEGGDYGWPICYGKGVHDTDFDKKRYVRNPCEDKADSFVDINPAHSAPLGLDFIMPRGSESLDLEQWPSEYHFDLIVAMHGSWNRSEPSGYKLVRYKMDEEGNYEGEEDFITGWLTENGKALGRPVDVKILLDGTMYVSDDKAGVVYKITMEQKNNKPRKQIRELSDFNFAVAGRVLTRHFLSDTL